MGPSKPEDHLSSPVNNQKMNESDEDCFKFISPQCHDVVCSQTETLQTHLHSVVWLFYAKQL